MVKAWLIGLAVVVLVVAAGAGLVLTWDSTRTEATEAFGPPVDLSSAGSGAADVDVEGGVIAGAGTGAGVGTGGSTSSTVSPLQAPPTTGTLPTCEYRDDPVAADPSTEWSTIVVDTAMRLPADYVPPDLVSVAEAGFGPSDDTIRRVVVDDLAALHAAAEAAGAPFNVVSGYRSYAYQENLFTRRVEAVGLAEATALTARPGHSEHQLGTTIDVLDPRSSELTDAFGTTPAGQWIAAHGHEFGFVLSYPPGARDETCYDYEPWHLRYVGRDVSADMHASGSSPRAYLLSHPPAG
jgi:D-alanyl-D-alanine carboxypeptidase